MNRRGLAVSELSVPSQAGHGAGAAHAAHPPHLAHHFDTPDQQYQSAVLGMWTFLVTEVLFLGALIAAYIIYRVNYAAGFADAAHHLNAELALANTGALLCSSLAMALAVRAAQVGKRGQLVFLLLLTVVLGAVFLGIKGYEYYVDYEEHLIPLKGFDFRFEGAHPEHARLFFGFYFALTGLHALHMIIGIAVMLVITFLAWRGRFTPEYYTPVEMTGLYWHFVDIVWVFLYPLLYLLHQNHI